MRNDQMIWQVSNDSAWHEVKPECYRHYSGVSIACKGTRWYGLDSKGNATSGYRTSIDALVSLAKKRFWTLDVFDTFTRNYGHSRHTVSAVSNNEPMFFVFWAASEEDFPTFVKNALTNYFFGNAKCAGCSAVMGSFRTGKIQLFDGISNLNRSYILCGCGYPVWKMESEAYFQASNALEQGRGTWNRKQSLVKAEGRHTKAEIKSIMDCQKGRCIYCHRLFADKLVASKDHLLPLVAGGSDWALNIVLACVSCNSKRCDIPFRTYCTLLSPTQNKRILVNLVHRLMTIDYDMVNVDAFGCLQEAIAAHNPKHSRYLAMKGNRSQFVKTKKLLPRTSLAILRAYEKM